MIFFGALRGDSISYFYSLLKKCLVILSDCITLLRCIRRDEHGCITCQNGCINVLKTKLPELESSS